MGDAPTEMRPVEPVPAAAVPVTPTRDELRRPYGRYAVIVVVALLVIGAIGSLSNSGTAATPTPGFTNTQRATGTPASTTATPPASIATPTPTAPTAPASPLAFGPTGSTTKGTVTRVIDGDTVVVEVGGTEYHVRYIGMDTPESVKPNTPVEAMAKEAAAANSALVEGQPVILERDVSETDRYDRLLRDVWVERDGALVLVGLELVRTGYAQVTTFPPDVKYVDLLLSAQETARSSELGLWGAESAPTAESVPTPKTLVGGGGSKCHPSYSPCLPIVDDLDCPDVRAMGKAPVKVKGPDDYRLDGDGDGIGCD